MKWKIKGVFPLSISKLPVLVGLLSALVNWLLLETTVQVSLGKLFQKVA